MAAPVNSRTAQRVAENFWKGLTHKVANIELVEELSTICMSSMSTSQKVL